ncbi:hypothetical protein GALL_432710 [mine drainage metagenome]|uniref:Uncharacterized protein n=1 Tax=mine drainage metagenome TaxID=410659 RepID=A0A1J5PW13_9ZZZZ
MNKIKSWLSRFRGRRVRLVESKAYEWQDLELGLYFEERPDDPVWKVVTPKIAELIQQGFSEIYHCTKLERYTDTDALTAEVIDTIGAIANRIGEPNNLNPAFTILVTHQYVDADPLMRQMYRTRWVAFMVKRNTFAPSPESYVDYINDRYFPSKQ